MNNSLYQLRANYLAFLVRCGMYTTAALVGNIKIAVDDSIPVAAVGREGDYIKIMLNSKVVNEYDELSAFFVLTHEVRHLYQLSDFSRAIDILDFSSVTSNPTRKMASTAFNVGADISLNQDVIKFMLNFYTNQMDETKIIDHMKTQVGSILLPEFLVKMVKEANLAITVNNNMDYVYYSNIFIKCMEEQNSGEGAGEQPPPGFDIHDFSKEGGSIEEDHAISEIARRAVEKSKAKGRAQSLANGCNPEEIPVGHQKLAKNLKKLLNRIRAKTGVLSSSRCKYRKTYMREHRKIADIIIPGLIKKTGRKPNLILVIDTSGSMMWDDAVLPQCVSVARELQKKGKIGYVYCCDTEIYEVRDYKNIRNLQGGGGTVFDSKIVKTILSNHGLTNATILYLTDEQVSGLEEVKQDPNIDLHIINVPEELMKDKT